MAPFSNYISFIFFTTLLLSLQINARDSQFFSKVTHLDDKNNNNNNVKETELSNKEGPVTKPEQQPVFIPETENSYGLYGHESSELPSTTPTTNDAPSTTTTSSYQPHKTEFEDPSRYHNDNYYNNNDAYNNNQNEFSKTRLTGTGYTRSNNNYNNNYYKKDAYWGNQNELSDTKYTEGNGKYYNNNNGANNRHYYNNNKYNAANNRYSYNHNAANDMFNGERQGMSDTRFMEGGKYYYDINSEKYNPTQYGVSSRGVNTDNWNNRGNNYFGNNGGYHGNNNAFRNQGEFEDEQDEFEP